MKRILFCSPVPLDPRLGMVKHCIDLADSLRSLGWETHAVGPDEIAGGPVRVTMETFPIALRNFLRRNAAGYDVVEFDHAYLPYPRSDFPLGPLFVARCMLLHHHFLTVPIPRLPGLWPGLKHILNAGRRRRQLEWIVNQTDVTVREADLTIVSNDRDAAALVKNGADPDRIAVFPLGLTSQRLQQFAAVPDVVPFRPVVGFVGTFEPRKGMCEFPRLVDQISRQVPGVSFRMLGTSGIVQDAYGVLSHFPRHLQPFLDVRPRFDPEELPGLLDGVTVGVFPSRVESFGYGVLEMLAAAVPVIAYDAPGPHAILPIEFRVKVGGWDDMAAKVVDLLADPIRLLEARRWARARAGDFRWDEIAARTVDVYEGRFARSGELNR
jgi:glycosyltransferase involved in cell wall biosynthesis